MDGYETYGNASVYPDTGGTAVMPPYDGSYWWPSVPTYPTIWWTQTESPKACTGDVHVFPCSRCRTCQCGQATLTAKRTKRAKG